MSTGVKLTIGGVIVAAVTGYMAWRGAQNSWQYYLTVDECLAASHSLGDSPLRVHGQVAPGSLDIAADRSRASFRLVGQSGRIDVTCRGPLPDGLKESIDVVVEGRLQNAETLDGDRVLTRCASKYKTQNSNAGESRTARTDTEARR